MEVYRTPGPAEPEGILLVVSNHDSDCHLTGSGHPECPARLAAAETGLLQAGLGEHLVWERPRPASLSELSVVHEPSYLDRLAHFVNSGGRALDPDTPVSGGSWQTALLAAGGGLVAAEALDAGRAAAALVVVRPPGHHAGAAVGRGFCLVNNVAVVAGLLAERGERVLIVDWDVHHGNGTQEIFWNDPRVLYVSTHQWPAYPGTGRPEEHGGPNAPGLTVNIPLPPGATGDVARAALEEVVAPLVGYFDPTWVLVSAGFDAHRADPLASLSFSAGDFADLAKVVASWAPRPGRLLAFLEGGYDLEALALSVGATASAWVGETYRPERPTSGGPGRDRVSALAQIWRERSHSL